MSVREQSTEVLDYLLKKYKNDIKNRSINIILTDNIFDPWINPDEGYIPYCFKCQQIYEEFKTSPKDICAMVHSSGCLWYDYYIKKISEINNKVIFKLNLQEREPKK
jgi:UDP-glucose 6-dehydrogenase